MLKRLAYTIGTIMVMTLAVYAVFQFSGNHNATASQAMKGGAPSAMPVEIEVVAPEKIQIWKNFSGNVVAVDQAEIRPQVSGRITDIHFEDGQYVEKGAVLIVIDPRPYQATVNQAKAALDAAITQAALAEKEYQRAKNLIKTEAIAQSVLDEKTNARQIAAAAVQGAEALLQSAEIDLDYAYVKAPISGKVSRAEITIGNLVQEGAGAPLLTSVISDEKVYVDFEVDERTYLSSVRNQGQDKDSDVPVRIELGNGDLEYKGYIHSFDNRIDPTSGTIRARAIFDNAGKILLPGMSVSVLMGSNGNEDQILVSERAIGTDQDRKFVYLIGTDGTAQYREIKIGDSVNGKRVVLSGLQKGDKVITEGIFRIRPGMPVMPKPETPPHEKKAS